MTLNCFGCCEPCAQCEILWFLCHYFDEFVKYTGVVDTDLVGLPDLTRKPVYVYNSPGHKN